MNGRFFSHRMWISCCEKRPSLFFRSRWIFLSLRTTKESIIQSGWPSRHHVCLPPYLLYYILKKTAILNTTYQTKNRCWARPIWNAFRGSCLKLSHRHPKICLETAMRSSLYPKPSVCPVKTLSFIRFPVFPLQIWLAAEFGSHYFHNIYLFRNACTLQTNAPSRMDVQ